MQGVIKIKKLPELFYIDEQAHAHKTSNSLLHPATEDNLLYQQHS